MCYNMLKILIFYMLIIYKNINAAVAIYPPEEKPEAFKDEKGCYLSSLKRLLDVDVPYSPQDGVSCVEYLCKESGDTYLFTCGSLAAGNGREVVAGNKTLPYPECCDSIECDDEVEGNNC
ncbi:uncharacterized protein LOC133318760 [Danaus plexippus]|nr:uncharacterized protein LOC133318760 [Danaus plexippus]